MNEINLHEFQIYSQNREDGILLYLLSKIGVYNKRFVEIGCGNGIECNTANLSLNFGFGGLLIDANSGKAEIAKEYYQQHDDIKVICELIGIENVNEVLQENCDSIEIDLLSIDIDGMDYWIWKEITAINPRIVVMEYNASFGEKSVTIPYKPYGFKRNAFHSSGYYHGASLNALNVLAKEKGYSLIGCDSNGVNSFFVRNDLIGSIKPILPSDAYYPDKKRLEVYSTEQQFNLIKSLPLVEI